VAARPKKRKTRLASLQTELAAFPAFDLDVDLHLLGTYERFEQFCLRLAKREFPGVMAMAGPYDEGRDLTLLHHVSQLQRSKKRRRKKIDGDIVWQCKFVRRLDANLKRSIKKSIAAVRDHGDVPVTKWILCLPIDPTGTFIRWLRAEIEPKGWDWEVWGRKTLLDKLGQHSDLIETYFYSVYEQLRRHFAIEHLELLQLELDSECQWLQQEGTLVFTQRGNVHNPDLVFDIVLQNSGRIDAVLLGIDAAISEWEIDPHGIPGQGLLFPQITYTVSLKGGRPGLHHAKCDPPLVVRHGSVERFKIRLTDTGYSWKGTIRIILDHGKGRLLPLPMMRIYT
jgi:hypothetical protein